MQIRKILHIDMDAFYASVEQRDNPELRGKPVAVGQADGRGVVAAASYEARRFGIRSAMSSSKAKRLCHDLVFVDCDFEKYKAVSAEIHEIFHEYTDLVEPISLDEAFLDVTSNFPNISLGVDIAREIKKKIRDNIGLIASAGVSYNKFLAKIASDYRKPDGLCVISPEYALDFIARMPVETFWGVGPVTAAKMHALGIYIGEDLRKFSLPELRLYFGKAARQYYDFARGIDNRPVEPYRIRKSIGCERTLEEDVKDFEQIFPILASLAEELEERVGKKSFEGTTLTLKVRYSDFTNSSRSVSGIENPVTALQLLALSKELLLKTDVQDKPIRLLGLTLSNNIKTDIDNPLQLRLDI